MNKITFYNLYPCKIYKVTKLLKKNLPQSVGGDPLRGLVVTREAQGESPYPIFFFFFKMSI
jgi:hypothetical protein